MRLAAVTPAYNDEKLITGCIKSLQPFVEEHIICLGDTPYFGDNYKQDKTQKIAEELGAKVVCGTWSLDHHQRNTGIALLQNYDYIICTDTDMWITHDDMRKLIKRIEESNSEAYIISQYSYWKDTDHILEGDDFKPVIAVKPHVNFVYIGNVGCPVYIIDDIKIHHLNWCEPKDIYKKVTTYPHASEFDGKKWYKENYENWSGDIAIMPEGGQEKFKVKYQPLPKELKEYL